MQTGHGLIDFFPPGPVPDTLSKKGFGELIGVTPGRVSQMITAGLPVEPNGRIGIAKGRAWVAANIDPNRRRASTGEGEAPFRSSRAEKDSADAMTARLKAERLAGNLIDRTATLRAIETRARMERDAWVAWVNRAAPELSAETGADLAAVVACLDRLVRDQLASLADLPTEGLAP